MADAIYQSICIFYICKGTYEDSDIDIFEFGATATTACMFVMLLHASIEIRSWVKSFYITIINFQSNINNFFLDGYTCFINFIFNWGILLVFIFI